MENLFFTVPALMTFVALAVVYPFIVACSPRTLTQLQYANELFLLVCLCGTGACVWGIVHHGDMVLLARGWIFGAIIGLFISGLLGLRLATR